MTHLLHGWVAIKRKDWRTAEEANRRALQIDPTNNMALNNLGVALQGQRRSKEALEIYQQAAQLDPNDEVARANIVRMVRPVSGLGLVWDFVRMAIVPWSIPIVLVQLIIRFVRSAQRRAQLRPGAQIYYDREWAGLAAPPATRVCRRGRVDRRLRSPGDRPAARVDLRGHRDPRRIPAA